MQYQRTQYDTNEDFWHAMAGYAQDGDKAAYHALLSDLSVFLPRYLMRSLASEDWAQDITQEILLSIHKSFHTYSPNRPFTPWMMAITSFRRTDYLRQHYRKQGEGSVSLENAEFLTSHVTNPTGAGEYKDIEAALAGLPAAQKVAFEMTKIHGYSVKETAEQTGTTESSVKVNVHRALKKLQEALK